MQENSPIKTNQHILAKGTISIAGGFVVANLCGYIIHFGLVRMVSPVEYGTFGVILSLATIFQLLLLRGVPDAASKYISAGYNWKVVKKKTLSLQLVFSLTISLLIVIFSPLLADLLNDQELKNYIRLLALFVPITAVTTLYRSFFNGFRDFSKTAVTLLFTYIPRVFFVFFLVLLGYGLFGAVAGYILGSLIGLISAIYILNRIKEKYVTHPNNIVRYKELCEFSYAIVLFSVFFELICNVDILFVKALISEGSMVGYYTSARVLSTIFVVVSSTLSKTLLPSISKSISLNDSLQTKDYIKKTLRYMFMMFLPGVFLVVATSEEILALLFTVEYSVAATALSILIIGWFLLQSFFIFAAILNASGNSKIPAVIAGASVPIAVIGNYFFIRNYGINGAASATLLAGIFSFTVGIYYIYRIYSVSIDFRSILRILLSSIIIFIISSFVSINGAVLIIWYVTMYFIYLFILLLLKEINMEDISLVKDLIGGIAEKWNLKRVAKNS